MKKVSLNPLNREYFTFMSLSFLFLGMHFTKLTF